MAIVKIERKQLCVIIASILLAAASYFIPVAETHPRAAQAVPKAQRLPESQGGTPEPVILTRRVFAAIPEAKPAAPTTGHRTSEAATVMRAKPVPSIERLTVRDVLPATGVQVSQDSPIIPVSQDPPFGLQSAVR